MYARKRFDIGWSDLLAGLHACAFPRDGSAQAAAVEAWFSPAGDAFACLSVRSGLELYLETLLASGAVQRGDEVLMSALTIPDMWKVVEHHGLVPVPVDIDARTLAPRPGKTHWPVRTSYIHPCQGQVRRMPLSFPSLSGPPR